MLSCSLENDPIQLRIQNTWVRQPQGGVYQSIIKFLLKLDREGVRISSTPLIHQ